MLPLQVVFQLKQDVRNEDVAAQAGRVAKLRRPLILRWQRRVRFLAD